MTTEALMDAASDVGSLIEERGASAVLVHFGIEPAGAVKTAWTLAHGDEDKATYLLHGLCWGLQTQMERTR